ncbi:hypothetical protein D3C78_1356500 [compost metagenome]
MASHDSNCVDGGVLQHGLQVGGCLNETCLFTMDDTIDATRSDNCMELRTGCLERRDQNPRSIVTRTNEAHHRLLWIQGYRSR